MTLDEWIQDHDTEWPSRDCDGFRLGKRGKIVWTAAYYPDGCQGHLVCVSRIVHENGETFSRNAYVDRDTSIEFVLKAKGQEAMTGKLHCDMQGLAAHCPTEGVMHYVDGVRRPLCLDHAKELRSRGVMANRRGNDHGQPYPHQGGCAGCRDERPSRCNVCGVAKVQVNMGSGCTNGRCRSCHETHCTSGGDTSPGHGFGTVY